MKNSQGERRCPGIIVTGCFSVNSCTETTLSGTKQLFCRFSEHYENVKLFHEKLQQRLTEYAAQRGEVYEPAVAGRATSAPASTRGPSETSIGPSKSFLVNNLRCVNTDALFLILWNIEGGHENKNLNDLKCVICVRELDVIGC